MPSFEKGCAPSDRNHHVDSIALDGDTSPLAIAPAGAPHCLLTPLYHGN